MPQLLLQNASSGNAEKISLGTSLASVRAFMSPSDFGSLERLSPDGKCWPWGLTVGSDNLKTYERLKIGDEVALITGEGIQYFMHPIFKTRNRPLAEYLFGTDRPYELMYFTSEPQSIRISFDEIQPNNGL